MTIMDYLLVEDIMGFGGTLEQAFNILTKDKLKIKFHGWETPRTMATGIASKHYH